MKQISVSGRKRKFSLIELLVAIAVIAILAALLLPALNKARVAGQSTLCLSNLKQLGIGAIQYVADTGYYPGGLWAKESGPYVNPNLDTSRGNSTVAFWGKVFLCPSPTALRFMNGGQAVQTNYLISGEWGGEAIFSSAGRILIMRRSTMSRTARSGCRRCGFCFLKTADRIPETGRPTSKVR